MCELRLFCIFFHSCKHDETCLQMRHFPSRSLPPALAHSLMTVGSRIESNRNETRTDFLCCSSLMHKLRPKLNFVNAISSHSARSATVITGFVCVCVCLEVWLEILHVPANAMLYLDGDFGMRRQWNTRMAHIFRIRCQQRRYANPCPNEIVRERRVPMPEWKKKKFQIYFISAGTSTRTHTHNNVVCMLHSQLQETTLRRHERCTQTRVPL